METNIQKTCLLCENIIRGRSDKRFCDDNCRNNYHNRKKEQSKALIGRINNTLKRNRSILEGFFTGEEQIIQVRREELLEKGYIFRYHTHLRKNKFGSFYKYCYDYGLLELKDDNCLLIKGLNL